MIDKDELIEFLRENLTIRIERNHEYYSHPCIEVELYLGNEKISSDNCTIYDGERG